MFNTNSMDNGGVNNITISSIAVVTLFLKSAFAVTLVKFGQEN